MRTNKSLIRFKNNKGHTIGLNPNLTIKQLVQMGLKDIRMVPKRTPLPDQWYKSID